MSGFVKELRILKCMVSLLDCLLACLHAFAALLIIVNARVAYDVIG